MSGDEAKATPGACDDRVSAGDYSAAGHLLRGGTLRRKLGTLIPFSWPLPSSIAARLLRFAGVRFRDVGKVFIGVGVWFDSAYPERISVGEHVIIGTGVKILAHSGPTVLQKDRPGCQAAAVTIEDGAMIGVGAILLPGVTIGRGATVAAGAVVTKSVAPGVTVAGNPAAKVGVTEKVEE